MKVTFEYDWLSKGVFVYLYFFLRTIGAIIVSAVLGMIFMKLKKSVVKAFNSI